MKNFTDVDSAMKVVGCDTPELATAEEKDREWGEVLASVLKGATPLDPPPAGKTPAVDRPDKDDPLAGRGARGAAPSEGV